MFLTYTLRQMAVPLSELVVIRGKLSSWGWKEEMHFGLTDVEEPVKHPHGNVD